MYTYSHAQAMGEVKVTASFLNNFGGDNVRRLAESFGVPGDHYGQMSHGYRWPYGPVAIVCPFNFPLEIPTLQLMGALFMGNKPVLKPAELCALVMEQFVRLLHYCGLDPHDIDILNCRGPVAQHVILETPVRVTQFTGNVSLVTAHVRTSYLSSFANLFSKILFIKYLPCIIQDHPKWQNIWHVKLVVKFSWKMQALIGKF